MRQNVAIGIAALAVALVGLAACASNQSAPTVLPTPTSLIGDAEVIWCEANIGAVASAAVNLNLYVAGTNDLAVVITRHDGSSETMTMSEALPLIVLEFRGWSGGTDDSSSHPWDARRMAQRRPPWLRTILCGGLRSSLEVQVR